MLTNILINALVKDLLIVLHPRLIESIDAGEISFVGDSQEEEVHEGSQMEGTAFPDGNMAAHASFGGQGFFVGAEGGLQHEGHGDSAGDIFFFAFHGDVSCFFIHGNELDQFVSGSLLVFLGEGVHIRGSHGSHGDSSV